MINWLQHYLTPAPQWPQHEVRYRLRPRDGIKFGVLPIEHVGDRLAYIKGTDDQGELYVAVCDMCGGNCGQCGTSIGEGVPFNFDRIILKSELWRGQPAGFGKR